MPKITSLETQKRYQDRYSLFLDGEFWKGIHAETVLNLRLKPGQEVSEGELEGIVRIEEERQAREYALKLLSYRPRSEDEIRRKLAGKGYGEDIMEAALDFLRCQKFVDDADFAQRWIEHRRQSRPMGRAGLGWELRQKGIDRNLVDSALESYPGESEREAALEAARRALTKATGDPASRKRKAVGMLQRRGFSWETIQDVLTALLSTEEEPETGEDTD
ncbi:MAG: regulatory protein RecX [Armatimonadetes bacterium]|nr:regulatory protein RecX [Armatimonadota bacterium]